MELQGSPLDRLFEDEKTVKRVRIKERLPYLFQLAELESSKTGKVGMQVGSFRENVVIGLLMYKFGKENVKTKFLNQYQEGKVNDKLLDGSWN